MITLSKSGNAVKFTFDENDHYLQNGTIEVPVNSLALIMDDSDMATFRKSASNDIFVSANYSEFGMSKAELEAWYKTYMVGSSGGGGGTGGTTPEEVQSMINSSLTDYYDKDDSDGRFQPKGDYATSGDIESAVSGLAESSAVTLEIAEATSGKADSSSLATVATSGSYDDLLNKPTIPSLDGYATEQWVSGFTYDKNTIDEKVAGGGSFDPTQYYNKTTTDELLAEKLDVSAYTPVDLSEYWTSAQTESAIGTSVSGYADSVQYNSTTKYMEFFHNGTGGTKVYEFDASPFLIDGMVENVEIKNVVGTQTFQTGYNSQTYSQNPYFIATNYDTSATNAVGNISSFSMTSSSGARVLLKVFSSGGTETTVYNNAFTYNGTLPSSDYVTATFSNDTFTFVPAEGYRISALNIYNAKDQDHMGMPEYNLCDLTVTAATTCLVVTFNTDAGKQDINIPISDIFDASNYYTKSETDTKINQSVSGKVNTYTYTAYTANTQSVLSGKADTTAMTQAISEAVSGKADTTAVTQEISEAVSGKQDTFANEDVLSGITSTDITNWNGKSDFSGSYNDLTDKPTIPTVPTSNTAFTNDAGYITSDALSGYAESSAVTEEITAAVSGKADSSDVYTKSEVDNAISAATDDMATETWVGQQGYITGVDLSNYATTAYVDGAVSGKVETSAITSAVTSASTDNEIPTAKAVYDATQSGGGGGMTEDDELLLATALTDLNDRKIDASEVKSNYQKKGDYATKAYVTTALEPYETKLDEINTEEVAAYALNELNERLIALETTVQALQALHNNEQ